MPTHRRISHMPTSTLEIQKGLILSMTYVVQETLRQALHTPFNLQKDQGLTTGDTIAGGSKHWD